MEDWHCLARGRYHRSQLKNMQAFFTFVMIIGYISNHLVHVNVCTRRWEVAHLKLRGCIPHICKCSITMGNGRRPIICCTLLPPVNNKFMCWGQSQIDCQPDNNCYKDRKYTDLILVQTSSSSRPSHSSATTASTRWCHPTFEQKQNHLLSKTNGVRQTNKYQVRDNQ